MSQLVERYDQIQARPFIQRFLPLLRNKINDYEQNCRDLNYRMTMEERTKGEDRKDQFRKMDDVNNILNMNQ